MLYIIIRFTPTTAQAFGDLRFHKDDILGSLWAFSFAGQVGGSFLTAVQRVMRRAGLRLDQNQGPPAAEAGAEVDVSWK